MRLTVRGGLVVDPASGIDRVADLHVAKGRVVGLGDLPEGFTADRVVDAAGLVVCPGLVDLRARLREPGLETKTTIAQETRAAAAGGITTLCCPPDTEPVVDTRAVVELIHQRAARAGMARVEVVGALTQGLQGQRLAEMGGLQKAGCVGVGNASQPVTSTEVMRLAMQYAATFGLTVFLEPQDPWLSAGRNAHDGAMATRLGLSGAPECAETVALARDLLLVEATGVRAHFGHLSTARGVQMVAEAQARGLPVSADVGVHHLYLTDADLSGFDARCHVSPPLRTGADRGGPRGGHLRPPAARSGRQAEPLRRNRRGDLGSRDPAPAGAEAGGGGGHRPERRPRGGDLGAGPYPGARPGHPGAWPGRGPLRLRPRGSVAGDGGVPRQPWPQHAVPGVGDEGPGGLHTARRPRRLRASARAREMSVNRGPA